MRTYEVNKNMERRWARAMGGGGGGGWVINIFKIKTNQIFKIITTITHVKLFNIFSTIVSV
jgi:hypothetical protein